MSQHAQLEQSAETLRQREIVAQVGRLLLRSLDADAALEGVAQLVVSTMADFCIVDVLTDDGSVRRVAASLREGLASPDISRNAHAYPPRLDSLHPVAEVIRTGRSVIVPDVSADDLAAWARDEQHLDLMHRLGCRSLIAVPLVARGHTLGAIQMVSVPPTRSFGDEDLSLAEEVAGLAGLVVDSTALLSEVQEAESRLRSLVQSIGGVVWTADPETFRFSFVSQGAETLLGYPVERWLADPGFWIELIHPDDRESVVVQRRAAIRVGEDHEVVYRASAADGRIVWLRDIVHLVREEDRAPQLRGLTVDVTAHIRTQRLLEVQHATMRVLAAASTIQQAAPRILRAIGEGLAWKAGAMWLVDFDHNVLRCLTVWNAPDASVEEFRALSMRTSFPVGVGLPGRIWGSGQAVWIEDVVADTNFPRAPVAAREGLHAAFGFPVIGHGTILGVIEFFHHEIRQPDDELLKVVATIGRQTGQFMSRVRVEQALRTSEARKTAILESALDCIITMDGDGRIVEFNPAAETTFGCPRDDAIGMHVRDLVPAVGGDLLQLELATRVELMGTRADGSEFPVEIAIVRVDVPGPPLFTAYLRDITERKRTERSLRESTERTAFLAEASTLLSASLDFDTTLMRVARLAVPRLADWCVVDIVDQDGITRRLAIEHADPAKVRFARELEQRFPYGPDAAGGAATVIRTGTPELTPVIDGRLRAGARNDEHLRVLSELGLRSMMCVPLVARGRTLGALTFVSAESGRIFDHSDLALAEDLAARAALAVDNSRLYKDRTEVARTLQESLVEPELPEIPGVQVGAVYRAAGEDLWAGGDFYDVFALGDGSWAVVVGDVCGKGAFAAGITAQARYTIRTAAMWEKDPGRILTVLNEAFLRQRSDRQFCTVALAHLHPGTRGARATIACGGHPIPLVLRADGVVEPAGVPGTLLGLFPEVSLTEEEINIGPGDALVLYTDGVTEARFGREVFGETRLRGAVASCTGLDAPAIAARLEQTVLEYTDGRLSDDVAVLVLRVP
jgi:PAS domain S-box-containing protein